MKRNSTNKDQKSRSKRHTSYRMHRRSVIRTFVLMTATVLLSSMAMSASAGVTDNEVDKTRASIEKWVETSRIISQEKHNYELAREMLSERIELVSREIETLRGKISEAKEGITETDKKQAELLQENEKLKEITGSLNRMAMNLEGKTKELLKRLPEPIRERVSPLSQRIPNNPAETKLSLSERFQNISWNSE